MTIHSLFIIHKNLDMQNDENNTNTIEITLYSSANFIKLCAFLRKFIDQKTNRPADDAEASVSCKHDADTTPI